MKLRIYAYAPLIKGLSSSESDILLLIKGQGPRRCLKVDGGVGGCELRPVEVELVDSTRSDGAAVSVKQREFRGLRARKKSLLQIRVLRDMVDYKDSVRSKFVVMQIGVTIRKKEHACRLFFNIRGMHVSEA